MSDRRSHNLDQTRAWLDRHYPDSAPGSPDPDQAPDQNKKGSRVIAKAGAQKRIDSALGGKRPDAKGRMLTVDREIARSDALLTRLLVRDPEGPYRSVARFVLLNVNTAGGMVELERIEKIGRDGDAAASVIGRMCRKVIRDVLDELDRMGYWLGWGTDQQEAERQRAAADRRKRGGVLATAEGQTGVEAIAAYRDLMEKTGHSAEEAKELTAEHFGCSVAKVEKATAGAGELAAS